MSTHPVRWSLLRGLARGGLGLVDGLFVGTRRRVVAQIEVGALP